MIGWTQGGGNMQSRFGLLNSPMPSFNNMRANYAQNFQNMGMQRPQFQPIANNMNIPRATFQDSGWAGFGQEPTPAPQYNFTNTLPAYFRNNMSSTTSDMINALVNRSMQR